MALTNCRECGQQVARRAASCPHCGVKAPGKSRLGTATSLGIVFLFVMLVATLSSSGRDDLAPGTQSAPTQTRVTRYTWNTVNVREGPSTNHPVVRQLPAGSTVEVGDFANGWYAAYANNRRIGYVAQSVLKTIP